MSTVFRTLSVLLLTAAACGGAKPAPAPATAGGDLHGECVATFQKQRECTDVFIPALVDLRAKLDVPTGIGQQVTADRNAVIAAANEEWKADSTDESIGKTCTGLTADLPPAMVNDMRSQVQKCLGETACEPFVACVLPIVEAHLTMEQPHHQAPSEAAPVR